jgi:hypothetical protein
MSSTDSVNGGSSNVLEDQLQVATLSSKQEQARLNEEADVLGEKTKRLREEADEIEREEKRLRKGASAAGRLHESLAFERLCLALRRNDNSTTEIKDSSTFPVGYAQTLGDALDKNTHVSSMQVSVKNLVLATASEEANIASDIRAYTTPLLDYIHSSEALRSVSMYSSHPTQHVDAEVVRLFLRACFENQHLEKL